MPVENVTSAALWPPFVGADGIDEPAGIDIDPIADELVEPGAVEVDWVELDWVELDWVELEELHAAKNSTAAADAVVAAARKTARIIGETFR